MKFRLKWDKTKLVSHFGHFWEGQKRRKRKKKKNKTTRKKNEKEIQERYEILWVCMETI